MATRLTRRRDRLGSSRRIRPCLRFSPFVSAGCLASTRPLRRRAKASPRLAAWSPSACAPPYCRVAGTWPFSSPLAASGAATAKRIAPMRGASAAGAEERCGRRTSPLTQNNRSRSTPVVSTAKSRISTFRQYIDSRGEETRTRFRRRPNVRRRFRGELSEQNPLGGYDFLRSTLSLIHPAGEAPAVRESVASAAERVLRRGFARRRLMNDVRPIDARIRR
jgi:hypothetical protein